MVEINTAAVTPPGPCPDPTALNHYPDHPTYDFVPYINLQLPVQRISLFNEW